jgi:LmbE family N-acetylglucosaminyl deacetylase
MTLPLNRDSRLLVFAPHPDDESLACGILLQRAVEAGAAICVIYLTDGENNPWPQRYLSRRWRLNASDRQRWAKLRRREALAALRVLGVSPADARFLGWPDQGLARLLESDAGAATARLRYLIREWSPSDVVGPDPADCHPDHRAFGAMLKGLCADGPAASVPPRCLSYIVHGRDERFLRDSTTVPQTPSQAETKRRAIACHQTQLLLSRRRFLRYAARPELLRLVAGREGDLNEMKPQLCLV